MFKSLVSHLHDRDFVAFLFQRNCESDNEDLSTKKSLSSEEKQHTIMR